jgi:hypothetical protein
MVCSPCKGARHSQCLNVGKDTNTWCDCQHKGPEPEAVVVSSWVTDLNGVTRKVRIEDVIEKLCGSDLRPNLAGVPQGSVPGSVGTRIADDSQKVESARL